MSLIGYISEINTNGNTFHMKISCMKNRCILDTSLKVNVHHLKIVCMKIEYILLYYYYMLLILNFNEDFYPPKTFCLQIQF